ncbi:hypothetical protein R84B8_02005 [Treponema sp. R8-4-B8]
MNNEKLTINNVSVRKHGVLQSPKTRKKLNCSLLITLLLITSLFVISCDLFSAPKVDLFKVISDEVDWANAPKLTVTVAFPPEWGNSPQSGEGKCGDTRMGYEFGVEFTPLSGYGFEKWLAFKTADYAGLDKTKSSSEVEGSALNGADVTITEDISETGARTAKVKINILESVTLVPWCGNRPRLSQQTNPPVNPIQVPFPFDQIVSIWFTLPVKASTLQDNIKVSAILLTDDERGQRGQLFGGDDGITNYFELLYDKDKALVDYVELRPKSTAEYPSTHLQLLSVSISVGPGIETEGGVSMAETQVIIYQTDTSVAQKAYRPATIQAKRQDGDWFQDGDWNNPTKDRRFNYANDRLKTVEIRFAIPATNVPENAPSVPNRITIIEKLSYDLGGYNSESSIEIPYSNINPSGGWYTISHELQTRTSGIIRLLVLPWHEENGVPLFQYMELNSAIAQGMYVTVVIDSAPPGLSGMGAEITGHVSAVSGLHIFGKETAMTLTLNRLSFLNDNGAQGGIPVSQAWNRPWTMDERKVLQWRVLVGDVIDSGWLNAEEEGVVNNVFTPVKEQTKDISDLTVDREYSVMVMFRDTIGNESTNDTGLTIKRIAGEVTQVTNLLAAYDAVSNSVTASWTTPDDMTGAYVYVNGAETRIDGQGAKSYKFTVPQINASGVREGQAIANVTRYDIRVEAYNAAGRAAAQELSIWNIPGMNINQTNTVLLDNDNFSANLVAAGSSGKNFIVTEDITINTAWTPVGSTGADTSFRGNFYGNGHTITISSGSGGLFGVIGLNNQNDNNVIRDLTVNYATMTVSSSGFGGIVYQAYGNTSILNCIVKSATNTATLTLNSSAITNAGGIVGDIRNSAYIQNCRAALNISLSVSGDYGINLGGVIGNKDPTANYKEITSVGQINIKKTNGSSTGITNYFGGIVGYGSGLSDCVFGGKIQFDATSNFGGNELYIGGITGTGGNIDGCSVTGDISANFSQVTAMFI